MARTEGFVSIVGAGPWDPGLLTLKARDRLRRADVVVADYLANPALLLHCRPEAEIVQREVGARRSGGDRRSHGGELDQAEIHAVMVARARAGLRVVRLKGGDPCLFGRAGEEAEHLRAHGVEFEIVPGVASPIAAPACAGIPITHREHTPAVTFVSGWEAYEKAGLSVAWEHLAKSAGTIVLMMSVRNARDNAARLIAAGRSPSTPAAAIRWGTRGIQRTVTGTLGDLADAIERAGLRPPAVMVVGDVVRLRDTLAWFETRPLHGRRIAVTRAFDRGAALADMLAEHGADVVPIPCLRIMPPEDPQAFHAALDRLGRLGSQIGGLVLSSVHGVDALVAGLMALGKDLRALAGVRVCAVGRTTAAAARARGLAPDLLATSPRSEGIVAALEQAGVLAKAWLHVRAEEGRPELGEAITRAGGSYEVAIAYRTEIPAVPPMLVRSLLGPDAGGEGLDALVLASGKAARHLRAILESILGPGSADALVRGTKVIALGPVTAAAVEAMGWPVAAVAAEPADAAVVAAVVGALSDAGPPPPHSVGDPVGDPVGDR